MKRKNLGNVGGINKLTLEGFNDLTKMWVVKIDWLHMWSWLGKNIAFIEIHYKYNVYVLTKFETVSLLAFSQWYTRFGRKFNSNMKKFKRNMKNYKLFSILKMENETNDNSLNKYSS